MLRPLIHGHTHRPAGHEVALDGTPGCRLVLSDWHDGRGEVLICDENGFRRQILGVTQRDYRLSLD